MIEKRILNSSSKWLHFLCCVLLFLVSCNTTKHVPKDKYLLRKYSLKIKSDKTITNKGVLQEQLDVLVIQKPNTYWSGMFPFKLWKYNLRSEKYINNPLIELPKSLERPVIYDSLAQKRTVANMQYFLVNQGYFNASIKLLQGLII
jgi:outer membrane protein insertion porin family